MRSRRAATVAAALRPPSAPLRRWVGGWLSGGSSGLAGRPDPVAGDCGGNISNGGALGTAGFVGQSTTACCRGTGLHASPACVCSMDAAAGHCRPSGRPSPPTHPPPSRARLAAVAQASSLPGISLCALLHRGRHPSLCARHAEGRGGRPRRQLAAGWSLVGRLATAPCSSLTRPREHPQPRGPLCTRHCIAKRSTCPAFAPQTTTSTKPPTLAPCLSFRPPGCRRRRPAPVHSPSRRCGRRRPPGHGGFALVGPRPGHAAPLWRPPARAG